MQTLTYAPKHAYRRPVATTGRFWLGRITSCTGSELTLFAVPVYAATVLHARPGQMALLVAAAGLPAMLGPLYAGPLVDAVDRRLLCWASDLVRAGALCAAFVLGATGSLGVPQLLGMCLVLGAAEAVFDAALFAVFPVVFPTETSLVTANGRHESIRSTSQLAGPAAAGGALRVVSAPLLLLLDAVSFLVSAWTIARSAPPAPAAWPDGHRPSYPALVVQGLVVLRSLPVVLLAAAASGAFNFFAGAAETVYLLYALRGLGVSPSTVGLLASAAAVGGVLAGMLAGRATARVGLRVALTAGLVLAASGDLAMAMTGSVGTASLAVLFAAQALSGFGVTVFIVANATLRQALVPASARGRVFASLRVLTRGCVPLGAAAAAALSASGLSVQQVLLTAGMGQLLVAVILMALGRVIPVRMEAEPA